MIVEYLLDIIFGLVYFCMESLPNGAFSLPDWIVSALSLITKGLGIFPIDVWIIVLSNGLFWLTVQFTWAIIEWIYKKIPGVD